MISTGWCPSCTCGWHKPVDAFDVTPPESECRNIECQCHESFWWSVQVDPLPMGDEHESLKRYAYGDR